MKMRGSNCHLLDGVGRFAAKHASCDASVTTMLRVVPSVPDRELDVDPALDAALVGALWEKRRRDVGGDLQRRGRDGFRRLDGDQLIE